MYEAVVSNYFLLCDMMYVVPLLHYVDTVPQSLPLPLAQVVLQKTVGERG